MITTPNARTNPSRDDSIPRRVRSIRIVETTRKIILERFDGEFVIKPGLVFETALGNDPASRIDRGWRGQVTVPPRVSLA